MYGKSNKQGLQTQIEKRFHSGGISRSSWGNPPDNNCHRERQLYPFCTFGLKNWQVF